MGKAVKVFTVIYLFVFFMGIYTIAQTSVNYSMALETNLKFSIRMNNLTVVNTNETVFLNMSLIAYNPSKLAVSFDSVYYTVWIYNISKRYNLSYPDAYETIDVYSDYDYSMTVPAGEYRYLNFTRELPNKAHMVNYVRERQSDAKIDYMFIASYGLVDFPEWDKMTVRVYTRWVVGKYGN